MTVRPKPSQGDVCTAERHGTSSAYDWWGCRCPEAREDHRLHRKRKREGRLPAILVPALGSARRLQALCAAGWGWKELGAELGVSLQRAREWAVDPAGMVHRETAERIADVFTRLAMVPGPSKVARTVGRRNGWAPPLAWLDIDDPAEEPDRGGSGADIVDEVAVERALAGESVELTDAELVAAVQTGVARGVPVTAVADLLGINALGAKRMLAGELPPAMEKRQRIERELRRSPAMSDTEVARRLGVQPATVTAARKRLTNQNKLAS